MKEDVERSNATLEYLTWSNVRIALLLYIALYVLYSFVAPYVHGNLGKAGQYGDMFGMVNAFASGLAMVGVMIAILLQRDQNITQAAELAVALQQAKDQTAALKAQVTTAQLQLEQAGKEYIERNKPVVFVDRWEHPEEENNHHYVMRNVGGGFAVNVYFIDGDNKEEVVYHLGSVAANAERRLPDWVNDKVVEATDYLGGAYILIAEGPPSRTTQWTPTLNFRTPEIDVRGGQVEHRLVVVQNDSPTGVQSLEEYIEKNLTELRKQLNAFWETESKRGEDALKRLQQGGDPDEAHE